MSKKEAENHEGVVNMVKTELVTKVAGLLPNLAQHPLQKRFLGVRALRQIDHRHNHFLFLDHVLG
jgi:hypothetical protein